jgi:hypothetical protein
MSLLKKLKCLLKKLFGRCKHKKCCEKPNLTLVPSPEPKPEAKPEPKPEAKPESKQEYKAPDYHREAHEGTPEKFVDEKGLYKDPRKSDFDNAKLQSFLWKPVSDNDGNPVIVVACDALRSFDLKVEIISEKGRKLKVDIDNAGRANPRHQDDFARIHFRLGRSAKNLQKAAPLTVLFFHENDGKKTVIAERKVKDPTKRIDK